MITSNPQALTVLKRKALNSIRSILFEDLNQDLENFEEKAEELAKKLLQEGLSALDSEKFNFPSFDETLSKISNDKNFQELQSLNPPSQSQGAIPLNNDLLTDVFQKLKKQASDKYDENFTLTLDLSSNENLKKESLMLPIIQKHKESDFVALFAAFRPLLFDLLKRREGFEDFVQVLRSLAKREKIASFNIIKQLEVKDVLLLLIESCSQASLPQLGLWFSYQFYPLPLIYLLGQKKYYFNLDCCLEYLFQVKKPLITSIGTKSALGLGKSSFLSYLFSTKDPVYFSTKNGLTHCGAIDLYINLPSDQQNYILADVQSFREDQEFMKLVSAVLAASQIILVHLTEKDIAQDGSVNLCFEMDHKRSHIVYLWRDYDEDAHSELMMKAEDKITESKNTNLLGIIAIPRLNSQNVDVQSDKSEAMRQLFEKLDNLKLQNCTPVVDLFKKLQLQKKAYVKINDAPKKADFDEEVKEVESLLTKETNRDPSQSFTKSLLPCLFQDYQIIEEKKKKKALLKERLGEMNEKQVNTQEEKYKEILKIIEKCKFKKRLIKQSSLIQKMMSVISSNEHYRILLLSEIINNWKMPRLEEIRKRFIALSAQKDGANIAEDQKSALVAEMDDKDLSLSTFLDEILSYHESNKDAESAPEFDGIQNYLLSCLSRGAPLNLVNGKTLKFGNHLLKEIFSKKLRSVKNIFVISIIGAQSSAKSTLLNVLFGCGFSTSAGRCTKGIYISLLRHQSGCKIIVIDTEGLLSIVARDHEFDNLITTMAFSCSHVVIINNRGEINAKLRDLLEICVYAMKHLKLTSIKPKVIFALRDILDNSVQTQQEMLLAMKSSLEQAANKLSININQIIDFSQEDIFLLPPAFQLSSGQNKTSIQINNNLFSSGVLEMRQYIFKYLASIPANGIPSLRFFYNQTKQLWNNISELGLDIMRAKNLLEIELKDEALEIVNTICKSYSEKLLEKGQQHIDFFREELRNDRIDSSSIEKFSLVLNDEYRNQKQRAFNELDDKIFNDKKYTILLTYSNEFKEIVEYNLRWQKQRFESEWKVSVYLWETDQEIKKLKTDIRKKVNEKLQSLNLEGLDAQIMTYFKDLSEKVKQEFNENMKQLRDSITNNLPREILTHFETAKKIANRDKAQARIFIPTIDDFFERIRGYTTFIYDENLLYKPPLVQKREETAKIAIRDEFRNFINNLGLIIDKKPSEVTAVNVINDLLSRISKLEKSEFSVNRATFLYYGLIEAMLTQYNKAFEVERKKTEEKQIKLQQEIKKEEQYVRDLLKNSSDSFGRGKSCAGHWFKEIKIGFCAQQGELIQKSIIDGIRNKFPTPESANKIAFEESFADQNYRNCLKYILNTNLFIQEIYVQEIQTLIQKQILKETQAQAQNFTALIKQVEAIVEEWSRTQVQAQLKTKDQIDLTTLSSFIKNNKDVEKYFPDLYRISLKDIDAFTQGCMTELATLIQTDNVEAELKTTFTEKVYQFLDSQYEIVAGCQARCPMCFTKCSLGNSPHEDHHANCHLLAAFCGSYVAETNELILRGCFDPINYQYHWRIGEKEFATYDEMIDKFHPAWRQDFPRADQPEEHKSEIPTYVKRCWIAIKDVLSQYYGRKENTPKSWLDQAKGIVPLPSDLYLEGYMNK